MRTAISIVLNGMHHLPKQVEFIPKIFDKWIIIEGAAKNTNCTSWCREMPESFHLNGKSIDGTSEFLQKIKCDKINVYQKDGLWNGKIEMLNFGLSNTKLESGFLWEIDIDEYWTESQIENSEKILNNLNADCAKFSCDFLLSDDIVVRGEWGESVSEGYKRLWKYNGISKFLSHEPPILEEEKVIVPTYLMPKFKHLSYYFEDQVIFKSKWYSGHENIYEGWKNIITGKTKLPCSVENLFNKPVNKNWSNTIITWK